MFTQKTKYTYFNVKNNVYSWIDHVLSTEYDVDTISDCKIAPHDDDYVSDHLPVRLQIKIKIARSDTKCPNVAVQNVFANWNRPASNLLYQSKLSAALRNIPICDLSGTDNSEKQVTIDNYVTDLCSTLLGVAKDSGVIPSKRNKPNNYSISKLMSLYVG